MTKTAQSTDSSSLDVLAIATHPDDVELSCGGTVAKLAQAKYRVGILDLTQGELGSRGDVATREAETKAASAALGVSWRENLKLPDGDIGGRRETRGNYNDHLLSAVRLFRQVRPELVLAPYWKDRHPDHTATSHLITDALYYAGLAQFDKGERKPFSARTVLYYMMRHAFSPSFVVDISDVFSKKLDAARCYQSQLGLDQKGNYVHAPNQPATLVSSPLTQHTLTARDVYFGGMIGVQYGEPFFANAPLPVDDPLKHYRENLKGPVLLFPAAT